jgi:hypothetical protein
MGSAQINRPNIGKPTKEAITVEQTVIVGVGDHSFVPCCAVARGGGILFFYFLF